MGSGVGEALVGGGNQALEGGESLGVVEVEQALVESEVTQGVGEALMEKVVGGEKQGVVGVGQVQNGGESHGVDEVEEALVRSGNQGARMEGQGGDLGAKVGGIAVGGPVNTQELIGELSEAEKICLKVSRRRGRRRMGASRQPIPTLKSGLRSNKTV